MSGTREKLGVCFQLGHLQRSLLGASRVESVQEKEESLTSISCKSIYFRSV